MARCLGAAEVCFERCFALLSFACKCVGYVTANVGFVHLYVTVNQTVEARPRIGRDAPAVVVKNTFEA